MTKRPPSKLCATALALVAMLAGCSAGQRAAGGFVPEPNARQDLQTSGAPVQPDGGTLTYVVSYVTNEILGFSSTASGNVAPSVIIGGSNTQLDQPDALAIDQNSGKFFVADGDYQDHRVLIFPKNSNGNVAPKILEGSNVPIQSTQGLAVDSAGRLYVSDYAADAIYVFAAGATGNASPIRTISGTATGLHQPGGMAFDSHGHLYVANLRDTVAPIEEFAAGVNGNAAPIATIGGNHTKLLGLYGVALDKHDRILAANGGSIEIFAAGAHGNVAPAATIKGSATTIADVTTAGSDPAGNIYGTNVISISNRKFSLIVFPSSAHGNVAPSRIISGSHTHVEDVWDPTSL